MMLIALPLAVSACDRPAGGTLDVQLLPSTVRPVVFITPGLYSPYTAHVCPFNLVIQTSATVTLDRVSIELIDGSNLGGPMIPIPPPRSTTPLRPTVILAGTTGTFPYQAPFSCGQVGRAVGVTAVLVDGGGGTYFARTTGQL